MRHRLAAGENLISALMDYLVFSMGGSVCISCWIMAFQLDFPMLADITHVTIVVFNPHSFQKSVESGIKYVFG